MEGVCCLGRVLIQKTINIIDDVNYRTNSDNCFLRAQAILVVLSPPVSNEMYLRDEEGSGSGYPTDRGRYPDDDEETNIDGEGSGSGYSEIGRLPP